MIQDSGHRRQFESGAVRDISEGRGRCDLLPLDVIADLLALHSNKGKVLACVYDFIHSGGKQYLGDALEAFNENCCHDIPTMALEVAIHFESGAAKYGERNWESGIPVHCYIDSAVRHYLKWLRGDTDERHDRAFAWNILCCIWTIKHKPEMIDLPVKEENHD